MTNPAMDNAQVTQADIDATQSVIDTWFNRSAIEIVFARHRQQAERDTLARHRLERSEPVGCQYPVHGSVTHVRNVECCDFCGHPADTTTPEPVAEIERLRGALRQISDLTGEINPSNYDHDDACELNRQFCYAITIAAQALKDTTHD